MIIRALHVAHMGKDRNACRVSVRNSQGKRLFEKTKRRREDTSSIEANIGEIRGEGLYWTSGSGWGRTASCFEQGNSPFGAVLVRYRCDDHIVFVSCTQQLHVSAIYTSHLR
jgi:hypothetical protein